MFVDACRKAKGFTRPVATSLRYQDGTVGTALNSFIMVNSDGWAITAAHTVDSLVKHEADRKKIAEIESESKAALTDDQILGFGKEMKTEE